MKITTTILMLLLIVLAAACTKETPTPTSQPAKHIEHWDSLHKWCYTCWELDANYIKVDFTKDQFCDSTKYSWYTTPMKGKPKYTCQKD